MSLTLHERVGASNKIFLDLTPFASGISVSSRLPGGYMSLTARLGLSYTDAARFQRLYLMHQLVLREQSLTLFEGRIEDMALRDNGLEITAYGYFSHLNDRVYEGVWYAEDPDNPGIYSRNPGGLAPTIPNIIKDALDLCDQISVYRGWIDPDNEITDDLPQDFTEQAIQVSDLIPQLTQYGDLAPTPNYVRFAIWESRVPFLWITDMQSVQWIMRRQDITAGSLDLTLSRGNLANKIKAVYSDENGERLYYPLEPYFPDLTTEVLNRFLTSLNAILDRLDSFPGDLNAEQQATLNGVIADLNALKADISGASALLPMEPAAQQVLLTGWQEVLSNAQNDLDQLDDQGSLTGEQESEVNGIKADLMSLSQDIATFTPSYTQEYLSGFAEDSRSQERYGVIERYISMGGIPEDFARAMVEAALADMKQPQFSCGLSFTGYAYSRAGGRHPLWAVRAGDIIEVVDLIPQTAHIEAIEVDWPRLRRLEVQEATYDWDRRQLTVVPSGPYSRLDVVTALANAGPRGV